MYKDCFSVTYSQVTPPVAKETLLIFVHQYKKKTKSDS